MILSIKELKKFIQIDKSPKEIAEKLTSLGLEVESVSDLSKKYSNIVVAKILDAQKHQNADKLRVCKVSDGLKEYQIVCGAPNAREGIFVAMAKVGSFVPGANFEIKLSKIRDVESQGMLCSLSELGIEGDSSGIIELQESDLGTSIAQYYNIDDVLIDVSLTPNRGDCASIYGIARELSVAFDLELKQLDDIKLDNTFKTDVNVFGLDEMSIHGVEIKNIKNTASPDWLKNALLNFGCKPNNCVVDVLNYCMYVYGQPMHAYDSGKIDKHIKISYSKHELFEGLDKNKYNLSDNLVISDASKVLCIAGVMGSEDSKTTLDTTSIFIESACFKKELIARSSQSLNLKSQSSFRFERGVDSSKSLQVLKIATKLIQELCGGEASDVKSDDRVPQKVEFIFNKSSIKDASGVEIDDNFISKTLKGLGFSYNENKILCPCHRHDISMSRDIAEEVLRFYGYDKIPTLPSDKFFQHALNLKENEKYNCQLETKRILASRGLTEVLNFAFIDSKIANDFYEINESLSVVNPVSNTLNTMRSNLLIGLLQNASKNLTPEVKNISIFEEGNVFNSPFEEGQMNIFAGIRLGCFKNHCLEAKKQVDIFDIKTDIFAILENVFSIKSGVLIEHKNLKYSHPKNSFQLKYQNKVIGYFGEMHPNILKNHFKNITQKVYFFELYTELLDASTKLKSHIFTKIQPIIREFSFIVDDKVKIQDIKKTVASQIKIKHKIEITDIYKDEKMLESKSVSLMVIFYPEEQLNSEEIDKIQENIINYAYKAINAKIRDGVVSN